MEKYELAKDIQVICATASSFPAGIMEAFKRLEELHPDMGTRTLYGISRPDETGNIVYKAAVAAAFEDEGDKYGCETFVIPAGQYLTETVINYMESPTPMIGSTFRKLLATPELDRDFPCVEWYKSPQELLCMVKLITT